MNIHQWAMNASPESASQKLVLLVLANAVNEGNEVSMTFEQLEENTRMMIRTIRKSLNALVDQGYIEDTGKRVGLGGNTKVWKLKAE